MKGVIVLTLTITLSAQVLQAQQLVKWKQRLTATGLSVGVNPLNPNSVYAQDNAGAFLVSYDRGRTWMTRGNLPSQQVREILVHPLDTTIILCAAFTGGLHRSSDDGLTWTTVIPGFGIDGESVALNPVHPDTMYAGDYSTTHVYQSTNAGSIKIYLGDFTRVLVAKARGVKTAKEIGFYIGRTERLVQEYLALITEVSGQQEYEERLESLRQRMEPVEGEKSFKKGHSSMVWRLA